MIGKRLKKLMEIKGINQKELSEKAGLTHVTISRYVNDKRGKEFDRLKDLCLELDVSADWLLGLKGDD